MLIALDQNTRERISPTPKARATCQCCDDIVMSKCGSIVTWHWSHLPGSLCSTGGEPMTEWHYQWQQLFPTEQQEIFFVDDTGKRHRADIHIPASENKPALTIEFQHSSISSEEVQQREAFYGSMGDLVWVVDVSKWSHPRLTRVNEHGKAYFGCYVRTCFSDVSNLCLDLGDGELLVVVRKPESRGWSEYEGYLVRKESFSANPMSAIAEAITKQQCELTQIAKAVAEEDKIIKEFSCSNWRMEIITRTEGSKDGSTYKKLHGYGNLRICDDRIKDEGLLGVLKLDDAVGYEQVRALLLKEKEFAQLEEDRKSQIRQRRILLDHYKKTLIQAKVRESKVHMRAYGFRDMTSRNGKSFRIHYCKSDRLGITATMFGNHGGGDRWDNLGDFLCKVQHQATGYRGSEDEYKIDKSSIEELPEAYDDEAEAQILFTWKGHNLAYMIYEQADATAPAEVESILGITLDEFDEVVDVWDRDLKAFTLTQSL